MMHTDSDGVPSANVVKPPLEDTLEGGRFMMSPPFSIGALIAIVVLVLAVMLALIGHVPMLLALLVGLLALARLT